MKYIFSFCVVLIYPYILLFKICGACFLLSRTLWHRDVLHPSSFLGQFRVHTVVIRFKAFFQKPSRELWVMQRVETEAFLITTVGYAGSEPKQTSARFEYLGCNELQTEPSKLLSCPFEHNCTDTCIWNTFAKEEWSLYAYGISDRYKCYAVATTVCTVISERSLQLLQRCICTGVNCSGV